MRGFLVRYLIYTALGLAVLALPPVRDGVIPAACVAMTQVAGYLAARPADIHGTRLQAAPDAFTIEIAPECLGSAVLVSLIAAMLAFPAPWRARAIGCLAALLLMVLSNGLRLAASYRLGMVWPVEEEWAHIHLTGPLFIITALAGFLLWLSWLQARTHGVRA